MQTMREVIDVIGYRHLADLLGCPAGTVSAWRSRDILPSEYWSEVAAECAKQGRPDVTVERLALIAARAKGRIPDVEQHEPSGSGSPGEAAMAPAE